MKKALFLLICMLAGTCAWALEENVMYSTGFEAAEGFEAGSVQVSAVQGPTSGKWAIMNGNITNESDYVINDSQSLGLRLGAGMDASYNISAFTTFNISFASKVTFNAKSSDISRISALRVYYSIDGGYNWAGEQTFDFTANGAVGSFTYLLPNGGQENVRLKFAAAVDGTSETENTYVNIDNVVVSEIVKEQTATPVISPNGAGFRKPLTVTITCATEGATILYSTDNWKTNGTYTEPLVLTATTTLKAKAIKTDGYHLLSDEASATFTYKEEPFEGAELEINLMLEGGETEAGWVNFGAFKVDNTDLTKYSGNKTFQIKFTNLDYGEPIHIGLTEESSYFAVSGTYENLVVSYDNIYLTSAQNYTAELGVSATGLDGFDKTEYFHIVLQVTADGRADVGTGVEDTETSANAVKTIRNGQVVIIRDGKMYNVLGRGVGNVER